ncbi:MAG: hypothetical protein DVB25_08760 [Verrucomicrobia bacterium]|nr:MAG: hypothetical protein DVB25_08760 [Verrucomicrobiota bacterium]
MSARATAEQPVMRDAVTEEQLVLAQRMARQLDPMKQLPVTQAVDPATLNHPQDLLSQSDLLCFDGIATLVPKHAILHIPEAYAQRLKITPAAHIVGWADFFAANRGWITTVEISRVQAEGKELIAEDSRKLLAKSHNLVVATYQGGPISLLAPQAPPSTKSTEPIKP